ncbi:MAG: hypothetical protein WA980_09980 [Shinella zoogloeoides]|uniref:hypothetical protein n=1 Tax=Shinella zoogloeoides TaxID=352475 RepID=UPI003C72141B
MKMLRLRHRRDRGGGLLQGAPYIHLPIVSALEEAKKRVPAPVASTAFTLKLETLSTDAPLQSIDD